MLPELVIGGVLLVPIIVALVELFKRFGLPTKYAVYANAVLTVGGYLLVLYVGVHPEQLDLVKAAINIVAIFLSSAGLYDRLQSTFLIRSNK